MWEYLILGAIVGWAIYYLGRTLLVRGGRGGCSCGSSCELEGRCPSAAGEGTTGEGSGCPDGPHLKGPPGRK